MKVEGIILNIRIITINIAFHTQYIKNSALTIQFPRKLNPVDLIAHKRRRQSFHDYISTLKMNIIDGRDFSRDMKTDGEEAIIINQSMAKHLGLDSPVGEEIVNHNKIWTVVGIVEDFHFNPLTEDITPVAFILRECQDIITLRISDENSDDTHAQVAALWQDFVPN